MTEHPQTESNVDERVATYLRVQSDSFGRRSMLMKVGKFLLKLSGLTLIPLLPVDRRFQASAQSTGSCSWQQCGQCGAYCNTCCGNSGGYSNCPTCAGMVKAGSWMQCCYPSPGGCPGTGTMFSYFDCCSTNKLSAANCTGMWCKNACYPNFPAYCASGSYYACTIVTAGGSC